MLCSFISLEGVDSGAAGEVSAREVEATQRTVACIAACHIEDIFADSKFLRAESLHELVKAVMWASGNIKRAVLQPEESDTAQVSHDDAVSIIPGARLTHDVVQGAKPSIFPIIQTCKCPTTCSPSAACIV